MNESSYSSAKVRLNLLYGEINKHAFKEYELYRETAALYEQIGEYEFVRFGKRVTVLQSPTAQPDDLTKALNLICKRRPTDFEPFGERNVETDPGPDCGNGCKHFVRLSSEVGAEWGVCTSNLSPRGGLLTSQRQGCRFYEDGRAEGLEPS